MPVCEQAEVSKRDAELHYRGEREAGGQGNVAAAGLVGLAPMWFGGGAVIQALGLKLHEAVALIHDNQTRTSAYTSPPQVGSLNEITVRSPELRHETVEIDSDCPWADALPI